MINLTPTEKAIPAEMVTILRDNPLHTGTLVSRHYYEATILVDSPSGGAVTVTGRDIEFF